jgi:hypothetical protein
MLLVNLILHENSLPLLQIKYLTDPCSVHIIYLFIIVISFSNNQSFDTLFLLTSNNLQVQISEGNNKH